MFNFKMLIKEFIEDESGVTTVEYVIAGSLVAAAVVLTFTNLGNTIGTEIHSLCNDLQNNATDGCDPALVVSG